MTKSPHSNLPIHLFSYNHNGCSWVIEIPAEDYEDAKARLAKLPFATYDGELVAKVPVSLGPAARLLTWARNSIQVLLPTRS